MLSDNIVINDNFVLFDKFMLFNTLHNTNNMNIINKTDNNNNAHRIGNTVNKGNFKKTIEDVKKLTGGKRERAERLLDKAMFMSSELDELQVILKDKGWTETYQNGANQNGIKRSSEADVYMNLMKNFLSTMKQLEDMLPESEETRPGAELMRFLAGEEN